MPRDWVRKPLSPADTQPFICTIAVRGAMRLSGMHSRHRPAADPQLSVPRDPIALCDGRGDLPWPANVSADRSWWPPTQDGVGEDRREMEQPRRARCLQSLAEASPWSLAAGSSYYEVLNKAMHSGKCC